MVGTFDGNIYALTLDGSGKHMIEQEKIAIDHFPFEPVIFIAQSPSGDIYYGGYHIYKLKSVYVSTKRQDLFPLEIKSSSSNVGIKEIRVSGIGGENVIDIRSSAYPTTNKNQSSSSSSSPFLQLSIPREIINHISSVTSAIANDQVDQPSTLPVSFALDENSSSSDNVITIRLKSGTYYPQLSIKGFTTISNISNIKTANNTAMTNTVANYNGPQNRASGTN